MSRGFTAEAVSDQSGRTFLVTGANSGLGFETAKVLADRGGRVLMGCRTESKARHAMHTIAEASPNADLEFVALDQADLGSVRAAATQVMGEERLDVLVNNAGIMMMPRELTVDGYESQFGVNHLGTFALTSLLLPKLAEVEGSRVVVTSSIAHKAGSIAFDDLDATQSYSRQGRYQQSKLANILFMYELHRRLAAANSATIAVGCHPGIAETELFRHISPVLNLLAPLARPFFNSAAQGAWTTLMAATGPTIKSGDYIGPSKRGETAGPATLASSTETARDPELARLLWERSVAMTGIDPGI